MIKVGLNRCTAKEQEERKDGEKEDAGKWRGKGEGQVIGKQRDRKDGLGKRVKDRGSERDDRDENDDNVDVCASGRKSRQGRRQNTNLET